MQVLPSRSLAPLALPAPRVPWEPRLPQLGGSLRHGAGAGSAAPPVLPLAVAPIPRTAPPTAQPVASSRGPQPVVGANSTSPAAPNAARVGGQAELVVLAGDGSPAPTFVLSTGWWVLIVILILVIIGLIIWWIWSIMRPNRPNDLCARDIVARDVAVSQNLTVSGSVELAGRTNVAHVTVGSFTFALATSAELNVLLDGSESAIKLTNGSGSIVTVTLPPAADYVGLTIYVFNETANAQFHVDPSGTDTIDGSNATAVESSKAAFVSMGIVASNLGNWKQIL